MFGKNKKIRALERNLSDSERTVQSLRDQSDKNSKDRAQLQEQIRTLHGKLADMTEKYLLSMLEVSKTKREVEDYHERLVDANHFIDDSSQYYGELFERVREMMRPGEEAWNMVGKSKPWEAI